LLTRSFSAAPAVDEAAPAIKTIEIERRNLEKKEAREHWARNGIDSFHGREGI
jgi:hypothetical protein